MTHYLEHIKGLVNKYVYPNSIDYNQIIFNDKKKIGYIGKTTSFHPLIRFECVEFDNVTIQLIEQLYDISINEDFHKITPNEFEHVLSDYLA